MINITTFVHTFLTLYADNTVQKVNIQQEIKKYIGILKKGKQNKEK